MTTTNKKADELNEIASDLMPEQAIEIKSFDSVLNDSDQAKFPPEFLNSLSVPGLPPHNLKIKRNLPMMLLRNINPFNGLCNGTILIIKNIYSRLIEANISIGNIRTSIYYFYTRVLSR